MLYPDPGSKRWTGMAHKKLTLPTKTCVACQRPFASRKKWERIGITSGSVPTVVGVQRAGAGARSLTQAHNRPQADEVEAGVLAAEQLGVTDVHP